MYSQRLLDFFDFQEKTKKCIHYLELVFSHWLNAISFGMIHSP
jgi:hypothetical protein